jgi:DNA-binding MarR family transcriptional regulator
MPMSKSRQNPHCISVYAFLKAYLKFHSFAPSQREIAMECHLSKSTVLRCLDRLEMDGLIMREPGLARSIAIRELD